MAVSETWPPNELAYQVRKKKGRKNVGGACINRACGGYAPVGGYFCTRCRSYVGISTTFSGQKQQGGNKNAKEA